MQGEEPSSPLRGTGIGTPDRAARGLEGEGHEGQFDVVVGNPPYVDSERSTKEDAGFRQRVAARYACARGNWDLYVPFVELAARLTREGGVFALVTPSKLVASDYCAAVQKLMLEMTPTACLDFSSLRPFQDARISVCIVAVRKTPPAAGHEVRFVRYGPGLLPEKTIAVRQELLRALPPGYMGAPLTIEDPTLLEIMTQHLPLATLAQVSDGATTAEAYAIRALVREGLECRDERDGLVRLVNTGTVEPFQTLWGARAISYLGFRGTYPVVPRAELERLAPRRLAQADRPKVIVGGMGDRIEAAPAPAGVLCGKSAVLILPREEVCPFALATVLNSTLLTRVYRGLFGLRGFSARSMAIGPRQVERLPVPPIQTLERCASLDESVPDQLLDAEETAWLSVLPADQLEQQVFERRLLSRIGGTLHRCLTASETRAMAGAEHAHGPWPVTGTVDLLDLAERAVGLAFGTEHALRDPDSELG